jgi:hypothetical protein
MAAAMDGDLTAQGGLAAQSVQVDLDGQGPRRGRRPVTRTGVTRMK